MLCSSLEWEQEIGKDRLVEGMEEVLCILERKIGALGWWISDEGSFALLPSRGHLTMSGDILVFTTVGKGVATGIW